MLYQVYQFHEDFMFPIRAAAGGSAAAVSLAPLGVTGTAAVRNLTAAYELTDAPIVAALIGAHRRGVDVRLRSWSAPCSARIF